MMDAIAAITMLALAVWLVRGAPKRRKPLTDAEKIEQRRREENAKALKLVNDAYENTPHWWVR